MKNVKMKNDLLLSVYVQLDALTTQELYHLYQGICSALEHREHFMSRIWKVPIHALEVQTIETQSPSNSRQFDLSFTDRCRNSSVENVGAPKYPGRCLGYWAIKAKDGQRPEDRMGESHYR